MFPAKPLIFASLLATTVITSAAVPADYLGTPFDDAAYRARIDASAKDKPNDAPEAGQPFIAWEGKISRGGEGWVGKAEAAASIAVEENAGEGSRSIHYRNSGNGHFSIFGWNWASPAETPINLDQFSSLSFAIRITGPKKLAELYVGFTAENPTPVSLRDYAPDFADGEWHTLSIPLRDFHWNRLAPKTDRTEAHGLVFMTYLWDKSEYEIQLDHLAFGRSAGAIAPRVESAPNPAAPAQVIPGRVECAFFDFGGEGVAYHDTDPINVLSGVLNQQKNHQRPKSTPYYWNFRKDEGVDLSYTKDFADFGHPNLVEPPENQLYIGSASDGEWCNYTVDVKKAGRYKITALYGNDANTISFAINHQPACECKFPVATGSMHKWNKAEVGEITFPESGRQLLTFSYNKGNNFAYFEFEPVDEPLK